MFKHLNAINNYLLPDTFSKSGSKHFVFLNKMYLSRDLTTDQNCNTVPRSDLCVKLRYEAFHILKTMTNV